MFGFLNGIRKYKEENKELMCKLNNLDKRLDSCEIYFQERLESHQDRILRTEIGLSSLTNKLFTKDASKDFKATSAKDTLKISKTEITESVNFLSKLCHDLASEAGWNDKPRDIGTDLMLIVSEVAEAMEGARKDLNDDHLSHRKMLDVELADALIRIMHTAFKSTPELGEIVYEKLVYNTQREDHKRENREKKGGKLF